MRTYIVLAFMFAVILYAQRDWFIALCAVIVFTALKEYPGLPNPLEAKGINHWSVMVLGVALGWLVWRMATRPEWNIPRGWLIVISLYLLAETIAIARLCLNLDVFSQRAALVNPGYAYYNVWAVLVDCFYGPVRFVFLGFLLLDGARTRRRLLLGLGAVLAAVLIYALVVDKEIPLSGLAAGGMQYRHRISRWTARHPNDVAQDLAAWFWIIIAVVQLKLGTRRWRLGMLAAAIAVLVALGHTQSRSGWLAFVATGLVVGALCRSWRILSVLSCVVVGAILFTPSITTRVLEGFGTSRYGQPDMNRVTAGRNTIWPAAIEGIAENPLFGHGRYGYVTSGAIDESFATGGGETHPHNAFLEAALDHGVLGAVVILGPLVYVLVAGTILVRSRSDPLLRWAGLAGVATAVAALAAGFGGQHFVLYENYWVFWCTCGLVVRARTLPDRSSMRVPSRGWDVMVPRRQASLVQWRTDDSV